MTPSKHTRGQCSNKDMHKGSYMPNERDMQEAKMPRFERGIQEAKKCNQRMPKERFFPWNRRKLQEALCLVHANMGEAFCVQERSYGLNEGLYAASYQLVN